MAITAKVLYWASCMAALINAGTVGYAVHKYMSDGQESSILITVGCLIMSVCFAIQSGRAVSRYDRLAGMLEERVRLSEIEMAIHPSETLQTEINDTREHLIKNRAVITL